MSGVKREISVVGAAIEDDEGRVLIVRRAAGETGAGFWEFPGGKIESGESPEEALVREIHEELQVEIAIRDDLGRIRHEYDTTIVHLRVFRARILSGELELTEHDALEWVFPRDLREEALLEADRPFVGALRMMASKTTDYQMIRERLDAWGWSPHFQLQMSGGVDLRRVGRLTQLSVSSVGVATESGEISANVSGNLRKFLNGEEKLTVGDWVKLRGGGNDGWTVEAVFARRNSLVRLAPGGEPQPLAANVDRLLIVTSLNDDFSLRRLERYGVMALDRNIEPVMVVNKIDEVDAETIVSARAELAARFPQVPVLFLSALTGEGVSELKSLLAPGETAVLAGSSGVGKSSIANLLLGEEVQRVHEIRAEDSKGRHTTVGRALFRLPGGGLLVDGPGLRGLELADADEGVDRLFDDLVQLTLKCRFTDCTHGSDPGCAVREALAQGSVDPDRWASFVKLQAPAEGKRRALPDRLRKDKAKKERKDPRGRGGWETDD